MTIRLALGTVEAVLSCAWVAKLFRFHGEEYKGLVVILMIDFRNLTRSHNLEAGLHRWSEDPLGETRQHIAWRSSVV